MYEPANKESKDINESQLIALCLDKVTHCLKLKRMTIVLGGPSPSDPEGNVAMYFSVLGQNGQGFWVGIDDEGNIVKSKSV